MPTAVSPSPMNKLKMAWRSHRIMALQIKSRPFDSVGSRLKVDMMNIYVGAAKLGILF